MENIFCSRKVSLCHLGLDGLDFALQTADHAVELSDLSLAVPQLVPVLGGLAGHLIKLEIEQKNSSWISPVYVAITAC